MEPEEDLLVAMEMGLFWSVADRALLWRRFVVLLEHSRVPAGTAKEDRKASPTFLPVVNLFGRTRLNWNTLKRNLWNLFKRIVFRSRTTFWNVVI